MPTKKPRLILKDTFGSIQHYELSSNGMSIYLRLTPNTTGIVTSDIVYTVGSRDESPGETGIAHMLEHMLFKPTTHDLQRKQPSRSMAFERDTGIILNANTWKDRTSYFFSYPKEHIETALSIEAERMRDVVLSSKEFVPEQGNVLSEYDMYAGDEYFCLSEEMMSLAFRSHPYGHETIGSREDIKNYTVEKLRAFYNRYYTPGNASLIIAGDISLSEAKKVILKIFGDIPDTGSSHTRQRIIEPQQNAIRRISVTKQSSKNIVAFGVRHAGFPTVGWFTAMIALEILAHGEDSVLHKALIDTHHARSVDYSIEPTYDPNIATLFVTTSNSRSLTTTETKVLSIIQSLRIADIQKAMRRIVPRTIVAEMKSRESSLGFVSEFVEYVSAGAPAAFFESEKIISGITARDVLMTLQTMFRPEHMVIGTSQSTQ